MAVKPISGDEFKDEDAKNPARVEMIAFRVVIGMILLIPLAGGMTGAFGGLEGMARLYGMEGQIVVPVGLRSNFRAISFMFSMIVPLVIWTLAALPERAGAFRIVVGCAFLAGFARLTGYLVDGSPGLIPTILMTLEFILMPILLLWHARLARLLSQQRLPASSSAHLA